MPAPSPNHDQSTPSPADDAVGSVTVPGYLVSAESPVRPIEGCRSSKRAFRAAISVLSRYSLYGLVGRSDGPIDLQCVAGSPRPRDDSGIAPPFPFITCQVQERVAEPVLAAARDNGRRGREAQSGQLLYLAGEHGEQRAINGTAPGSS